MWKSSTRIWEHGLEQKYLMATTHLFIWQRSSAATSSMINYGSSSASRATSLCGTGYRGATQIITSHENHNHTKHIEASATPIILRASTTRTMTLLASISPMTKKKHDTDHSTHDLTSHPAAGQHAYSFRSYQKFSTRYRPRDAYTFPLLDYHVMLRYPRKSYKTSQIVYSADQSLQTKAH